MRRIYLLFILFFTLSCKNRQESDFTENKTSVKGLYLSGYSQEGRDWDLKCEKAEIDEKNKKIKCEKPVIYTLKENKITAEIKGETGIIDMVREKSFIKNNVRIISEEKKTKLYSSQIYFDSAKNIIWSDSKVKIITEDTETSALGFSAKPDLSRINFYKHETKKI
ncbi:MAG: LPS export ABC transporter periplasmic protein LptC [Elusimicrobiota bacterium]